ncbi:MAG TPA: hypothetical protein DCS93_18695 [Microscillaceae bacterium]|nr:hypothetical protein [Microscillaceae bacterium]
MELLTSLNEILFLIPLIAGIALITWLVDNRLKDNQFVANITDARAIFRLLIGVVVLGGVYLLDYSYDYGCIIIRDARLTSENFKYTSIALFLICLGYLLPKQNLRVAVLSLELTLWLYKLYFIKGGYNTGLGGGADLGVLGYDFIALVLRLAFLRKINQLHINPHWIWITTFIILYLRMNLL